MYKCLDCGHIFEDGEQTVIDDVSVGYHAEECPVCGGMFEEAHTCRQCDGHFLCDELHDGYCVDCLREFVTYDSALEYLVDGNMLADFMLAKFYECDDVPAPLNVSEKFIDAMRENYQRMKADDLLCNRFDFLDCVREYIIDDDECERGNFADWLTERK